MTQPLRLKRRPSAMNASALRKPRLRIDRLKNFGIVDEVTVGAAGLNGKMNEARERLQNGEPLTGRYAENNISSIISHIFRAKAFDLIDQLITRQARSHRREVRAAGAPHAFQCMTVAAIFVLQQNGALEFDGATRPYD